MERNNAQPLCETERFLIVMSKLRYEKFTYELRGFIFEAHNKLKTGWPEEVYHQGLVQLLRDKEIPVDSKPRKSIVHRGIEVHHFECDLLVWELIILELKTLPFTTFAAQHYAQLIHYLKCWNKNLGLLVNFGPPQVEIKRVVWDDPELKILQNYTPIEPYLSDTDRLTLDRIWQAILALGQQYGLGYPETMYCSLAAIELKHNGLNCQREIKIPAKWNEQVLGQHSSDYLLVDKHYLLHIRSLLDRPTRYDFAQMKTYLNNLGLKIGLIVNFGKRQLQIYGVSPD